MCRSCAVEAGRPAGGIVGTGQDNGRSQQMGAEADMEFRTDILGTPYESVELPLAPDEEGAVSATLVRRLVPGSRRAVLYVHGYVDYFFQTHLADHFVEAGFSFYALDL